MDSAELHEALNDRQKQVVRMRIFCFGERRGFVAADRAARTTQELSVPTRNLHHAMQVIIEKIGLRLRFAPAGLPISSIEGDSINNEQNDNRRRYGEERSHIQKSTFNY